MCHCSFGQNLLGNCPDFPNRSKTKIITVGGHPYVDSSQKNRRQAAALYNLPYFVTIFTTLTWHSKEWQVIGSLIIHQFKALFHLWDPKSVLCSPRSLYIILGEGGKCNPGWEAASYSQLRLERRSTWETPVEAVRDLAGFWTTRPSRNSDWSLMKESVGC